jgi:Tfp pilus assembly protein PilV
MRHRHHARAGLTLLEVLVAMLLLTVGTLTTLSTQVAIARLQSHDSTRQRAASSAAAILDSLRATSCASLTSGSSLEPDARLDWTSHVAADLASVALVVTPTRGTPWTAATLVPCA